MIAPDFPTELLCGSPDFTTQFFACLSENRVELLFWIARRGRTYLLTPSLQTPEELEPAQALRDQECAFALSDVAGLIRIASSL